jgi:hypothetical protein
MAPASDRDGPAPASHEGDDQPRKEEPPASDTTPKRPGPLKRAWTAIGLNPPTVIIMAKGSLPPIISLAALRSKTFAEKYTTLGYLVVIMSLLGFAILPRAKFVQSMMLNIVGFRQAGGPFDVADNVRSSCVLAPPSLYCNV